MKLKGQAKVKTQTKHTENLFGDISVIQGQTLKVIDRNNQGDCMCLLPSQDKLIDVDHRDIEEFLPEPISQNPIDAFFAMMRT